MAYGMHWPTSIDSAVPIVNNKYRIGPAKDESSRESLAKSRHARDGVFGSVCNSMCRQSRKLPLRRQHSENWNGKRDYRYETIHFSGSDLGDRIDGLF